MLIRAYGEFWSPDIVDWGSKGAGNSGKLLGKVKTKQTVAGEEKSINPLIDFWDAKGIYVLYYEFQPVYVGKAFSNGLGKRLRDHLTDRLAGRWDMFSWFSLSTINIGDKNVRAPGKRQLLPETINNTLEALSIMIIDPKLNRKRESLKEALEATQPERTNPMTIRNYLEQILSNTSE